MKKFRMLFLMGLMILGLTGCSKELSMSFFYTIEKGETIERIDQKKIALFKENGFVVEEYEDVALKGYKITMKISDLDDVSSEDEHTWNLNMLGTSNETKIFTVKKGLFKNTYYAKFEGMNLNNYAMDLIPSISGPAYDIDNSLPNADDDTIPDDQKNPLFPDISGETPGLDVDDDIIPSVNFKDEDAINEAVSNRNSSYSVKKLASAPVVSGNLNNTNMRLTIESPVGINKSNASDLDDSSKKMTWNFANANAGVIEFEFELYNTANILMVVAIIIFLVEISLIIKKNFSKKKK